MKDVKSLTETQMRIGNAAFSLFAEGGYKATTTKQIAKEAGVNESTLFKNFKSKLDIFMVMKQMKMDHIEQECKVFFKKPVIDMESFTEDATLFIYKLFLDHTDLVMIMLKELGHADLNIGHNSLFEKVIAMLSDKLSSIKGSDDPNHSYTSQSFVLVSSIVFLIIDQRHGNILTDEFEKSVSLLDISKLISKTV